MTRKALTRERIIQAAFELISDKGFAGVSTREIARRAGVAEVTLFRHFTSKENLFRQTTQNNSTIPVLEKLIPTILDKPVNEGIASLVDAYLERLSDSRSWIRIFQMELQRDPDTFRPLYQSFLDELYSTCGSYFAELAKRNTSICCDPKLAAKVFVMLCFGFFQVEEMQLGNSCRNNENKPVVDAMVKMLFKGMIGRKRCPQTICEGGERLL